MEHTRITSRNINPPKGFYPTQSLQENSLERRESNSLSPRLKMMAFYFADLAPFIKKFLLKHLCLDTLNPTTPSNTRHVIPRTICCTCFSRISGEKLSPPDTCRTLGTRAPMLSRSYCSFRATVLSPRANGRSLRCWHCAIFPFSFYVGCASEHLYLTDVVL